ncbi:hypothetical protein LVD15_01795 [Fulvivirga maritima]|uniref:hypothetical protein n=1 Tax=Fulvivirga maritima TaxID=2904247 RepID=UPI001F203A07|nr:hypothetical protein [Fulvivirga maritima]UII27184.1 hypothetical protein LVD15_01795 [Fulvivirga maritima]
MHDMKLVNIIWAIHFMAVSLSPHTDLCELRELPEIFDHYQQHQADSSESFLEYFAEDYLSFKSSDKHNHSESDSLPFHDHINHSHCCNFTITDRPSIALNQKTERKLSLPIYQFSASTSDLTNIFQPPKG